MLQHLGVVFLSQLLHILRNLFLTDIIAQIVIIHVGFHFHQVNDTLKGIFRTNGELDRNGVTFQTVFHHLDHAIEIGAHDVHLVDVSHTRYVIFISLTPNGLRLRLNTALGAQYGNRTVQNAQRTLYLYGKVHVAGSVDDINSVFFPETGRSSRGNGNTSLLLLCHPVHGGRAVMGFTNLMIDAGVIQDTLCCSGFTGINMSHDTDIAG